MVKGKAFGIDDHRFLERQAEGLTPYASVFEGVTNAVAAGATKIDIYPNDNGMISIEDDGHGIPSGKFEEYLGHFGAGKNPRHRGGHFGIGAKSVMAMQNPKNGALFTSWVDRSGASQVTLAKVSDIHYGFRLWPNSNSVVRSARIPRHSRQQSGTLVELQDQRFVPYQILTFLNNRFLKPSCPIKVWQRRGEELKARNAIGLLECMKALCQATGAVELKHCTLHWGIKKDENPEFVTFQKNFLEHVFSGHSFFLAWKDICHASFHLNRGGAQRLTEWGIYAGQSQVMMVIQAKGAQVDAKLDRESLIGWDEDAAKEEVRNNLPRDLEEFVTEQQNKLDIQDEAPLVQRLARFFELPNVLHTGRVRSTSGTEEGEGGSSGTSGGANGGNGGGSPLPRLKPRPGLVSPDPTRKTHRIPEVIFSDQIGNQPLVVNEESIYINKTFPTVKELLDGVTKPQEANKIRALIATEILTAVTKFNAHVGRIPTEQELLPTLLSSGLALLHVKSKGKGINFRAMGVK